MNPRSIWMQIKLTLKWIQLAPELFLTNVCPKLFNLFTAIFSK